MISKLDIRMETFPQLFEIIGADGEIWTRDQPITNYVEAIKTLLIMIFYAW